MTQAPSIAEEQRLIAEDFALFDDWREKIEYVLDLGRNLTPFPEEHRTEPAFLAAYPSELLDRLPCLPPGEG